MSKKNNTNRARLKMCMSIKMHNYCIFQKYYCYVNVRLINIIAYIFRDPQELKSSVTDSVYSQRFYRYMNAARHGQDGGDCLSTYPCNNNAE